MDGKTKPMLLPMPRRLEKTGGSFAVQSQRRFIQIDPGFATELMIAARVIQSSAQESLKQTCSIVAGNGNATDIAVTLQIARDFQESPAVSAGTSGTFPEHYSIDITPHQIAIRASSPAMCFYASQTLAQLFRQLPDAIPCLHIDDWPDFAARGVMLDISRDKVATMATLFSLVDLLASMKINQLQLYTEHTFAYRGHGEVWAQASPMTGEEILELDAYCRQRFIQLVPNQNSFGHMERWLRLPRYAPLAEAPDGFTFPWGLKHEGGFTLDPLNPESLKLVESLYDELLPHFTSRLFNVGCDETFDLGLGRSKAEVEARGKERVYVEFLLKIYRAVKERGHQMMFWGDIILHKPELIPELPRDMIALNWGYDAGHPFEKETRAFAEAGVPFYVCPGTSSWLSIAGRTDNCIANLQDAADQGLKHAAIGYLNTDWGDIGHLQYLPISYLGFAAGAAYSWCAEANREAPIADLLSLHIFRDSAGEMGSLVADLGNVYKIVAAKQFNSTALFWSLAGGEERKKHYEVITREQADESESRLGEIEQRLSRVRLQTPHGAQTIAEIACAIAMLKHACRRARWRLDRASEDAGDLAADLRQIIGEHERLWLGRNRVGGLRDSVRRLENRLGEYGARRAGSAFG